MKKWLTYDIEATFLRKGGKRSMTKLLELALHNDEFSFQRLINPLKQYDTGEEIVEELFDVQQHPENTLNFWTKLLIGKKALKSNVKRMDKYGQAAEISLLLKRSDVARKYEDSMGMLYALERNYDDEEKAKNDIRKGDSGRSLLFFSSTEAIEDAIKRGKNHVWVAHNGTAFDSKILLGHTGHNWDDIQFEDSLPLLKHLKPGEDSYSQPLLFKSIFKGQSYFAHHALDDAMALHKLLTHILDEKDIFEEIETTKAKRKKKKSGKKPHSSSNLYDINGVGPKSVAVFHDNKITSKEQLFNVVATMEFSDWCETFSKVHQHKKLWERLNEVYKDNTAVV